MCVDPYSAKDSEEPGRDLSPLSEQFRPLLGTRLANSSPNRLESPLARWARQAPPRCLSGVAVRCCLQKDARVTSGPLCSSFLRNHCPHSLFLCLETSFFEHLIWFSIRFQWSEGTCYTSYSLHLVFIYLCQHFIHGHGPCFIYFCIQQSTLHRTLRRTNIQEMTGERRMMSPRH